MNYQVMQQVKGKEFKPVLHPETQEPAINLDRDEAKRVAVELTRILGVKCQPRPMTETADDWRAREQRRFDNGEYKPVVWVGQPWFDQNVNKDHFVHVSIKDPTRIAFTRNDKDGMKDTQTSTKPGKYLTEFFGKVLTAEEIRTYAMDHSTQFENKELKFATTVEEIQEVYEQDGLGSCFSGTTKANLYGSGDFAVAYIEKGGKVTARAVCVPSRKIHARIYGDYRRLSDLLEKDGYSEGQYGDSCWKGLRLLTKWYWPGFYTDFGGYPKPAKKDTEFFTT